MNKNAFINAACALLGAGGRGFVKALAFVLLGAFCAPVFGSEIPEKNRSEALNRISPEFHSEYEALHNVSSYMDTCDMYSGFFYNDTCYFYLENEEKAKRFFRVSPEKSKIIDMVWKVSFKKLRIARTICLYQGYKCPWQFRADPKNVCFVRERAHALNSLTINISKTGLLDYIKRNFNVADEQSAIKGACQVILGTFEQAISDVEVVMKTCKAEKAECLENSYCPYKDSEYEAGLRGLEKLREPYLPLAEEAKKCIKDTENFLNPAAASE